MSGGGGISGMIQNAISQLPSNMQNYVGGQGTSSQMNPGTAGPTNQQGQPNPYQYGYQGPSNYNYGGGGNYNTLAQDMAFQQTGPYSFDPSGQFNYQGAFSQWGQPQSGLAQPGGPGGMVPGRQFLPMPQRYTPSQRSIAPWPGQGFGGWPGSNLWRGRTQGISTMPSARGGAFAQFPYSGGPGSYTSPGSMGYGGGSGMSGGRNPWANRFNRFGSGGLPPPSYEGERGIYGWAGPMRMY